MRVAALRDERGAVPQLCRLVSQQPDNLAFNLGFHIRLNAQMATSEDGDEDDAEEAGDAEDEEEAAQSGGSPSSAQSVRARAFGLGFRA